MKKRIPIFFKISSAIFLISAVLLFVARRSVAFSELVSGSLSQGFRRLMAAVGGVSSRSLFELILLSVPLLIIIIVLLLIRAVKKERLLPTALSLVSVAMLLWSGNAVALGVGYNSTPISERVDISPVTVDADSLSYTLEVLVEEVNSLVGQVSRDSDGVAVTDLTLGEISARICTSYDALAEKYGLYEGFSSEAKPVSSLHLLSRLGLSGIYTYYTGEANVNADYPTYDVVFTAAHELSHQRGIMRENEANFAAYLICSTSQDPLLRYSAALNMTEYIGAALYRTDGERYYEIMDTLSPLAKNDIAASRAVSQNYGGGVLAEISSLVNDLFLKSNGTPGTVSYGMVVELAVAYIAEGR